MMFSLPLKNLALIVLVGLVVKILSLIGAFVSLDFWLYDRTVPLARAFQHNQAQVLLVAAAHERYPAQTWQALIDGLLDKGAERVVITFLPLHPPASAYAGQVIWGRSVNPDGVLQDLPTSWSEQSPEWAVSRRPEQQRGIYRTAKRHIDVNKRRYPTFMGVISEDPLASYVVNFNMGQDYLPHVSLETALTDDLIAEWVRGKTVLVGTAHAREFLTPLGDKAPISLLQYYAYAIDSLLQDQSIQVLGNVVKTGIFLVILVLSILTYQWLHFIPSLWLTLVLLGGYASLAWVLLGLCQCWVPLAEIISLQIVLFGFVFIQKTRVNEMQINSMLVERTQQLHRRLELPNFYQSEDPWTHVINLVNQTLRLNRAIFLEKVPKDHRVREIKALNCSLDDILEMRRDYTRHPYELAIVENKCVVLQRLFFEDATESEVQHLVPLSYAGEILGFWAFGVEKDKLNGAQFLTTVDDFARQIGDMIYHRQQIQQKQALDEAFLQRYFSLKMTDQTLRALDTSILRLENRLNLFESVFAKLNTAIVVYDLFGRVLYANQRVSQFAEAHGIDLFQSTALDLLTTICALDIDRARDLLRAVLLEQQEFNVPVHLPNAEEGYILLIEPLADEQTRSQQLPFQRNGYVFELVDVSYLKRLYKLKEQLFEKLDSQLRNDAEALIVSAELLARPTLPEAQRERVSIILRDKIDNTIATLNSVHEYVGFEVDTLPAERYPVDPVKLLRITVDALANEIDAQGVQITMAVPTYVSLVIAEPKNLEGVYRSLLQHLIQDAAKGSKLYIEVDESTECVRCVLYNEGFGIPQDKLDAFLGDVGDASDAYAQLHNAAHLLPQWGGGFSAQSELGVGFRFTLKLKGFI